MSVCRRLSGNPTLSAVTIGIVAGNPAANNRRESSFGITIDPVGRSNENILPSRGFAGLFRSYRNP